MREETKHWPQFHISPLIFLTTFKARVNCHSSHNSYQKLLFLCRMFFFFHASNSVPMMCWRDTRLLKIPFLNTAGPKEAPKVSEASNSWPGLFSCPFFSDNDILYSPQSCDRRMRKGNIKRLWGDGGCVENLAHHPISPLSCSWRGTLIQLEAWIPRTLMKKPLWLCQSSPREGLYFLWALKTHVLFCMGLPAEHILCRHARVETKQ